MLLLSEELPGSAATLCDCYSVEGQMAENSLSFDLCHH